MGSAQGRVVGHGGEERTRGEGEGGRIKGGGPLGSTCEDSESADYLYSWAGNGPTETIRALGRGRRAASGL